MTTRRTSVRPTAWTVSQAWKGRRREREERLREGRGDLLADAAGVDAHRLVVAGPAREPQEGVDEREARDGEAAEREDERVSGEGRPRRREEKESAGATRLRRRLSRIFHWLTSGSPFFAKPRRVGTTGRSHARICQSPRIQRCWRRACARTFEGKSSTSSTSETRAVRA